MAAGGSTVGGGEDCKDQCYSHLATEAHQKSDSELNGMGRIQ